MAKYEGAVRGDVDELLAHLHEQVLATSASATLEDGSNVDLDEVHVRVRVYERYSMAGGNRVSLTVTLVGAGGWVQVSMIASGGSQAMFHKVNTWGEETFLQTAVDALGRWQGVSAG